MQRLILGDCLEEMRKMEDNSISAIVTDPPYGLSFMSKGWDHEVPGKEYWSECYRISRPGSFLIAMGGSRTFHRLACAIEEGGYNIRDCISWLYGSGFPKSHNNFGLTGYGTALKPAWEPCIVAMKPLDGTFKENAEKWGQAGINIDGCRIEAESRKICNYDSKGSQGCISRGSEGNHSGQEYKEKIETKGRWPANVILDEEAGRMLDEQSGVGKSQSGGLSYNKNSIHLNGKAPYKRSGHDDSGGASRFFYCAKASSSERNEGLEGLPVMTRQQDGDPKNWDLSEGKMRARLCTKPQMNHHPTVKPLKLMEYLIKLIMPPKDGILLDPFCGSGTTVLAAKRLGFDAIGIEKQEDYIKIAQARLEHENQ